MNELATRLNAQIAAAIDNYNAPLDYPKVKFINFDKEPGIYEGHRFCEPGVQEPLKGKAQNAVAFFYDAGDDDVPTESEGFNMPPSYGGASNSGLVNVTSSSCSENELGDPEVPDVDPMLCSLAKSIANNTLSISDFENSGDADVGSAVVNPDGSVTITDWLTPYVKMFHPKTRTNWRIAQRINKELIWN